MRHRRWLLLSFALVASGCARTVVQDPLDTVRPAELTGDAAAVAELDFLNRLAERPVVSNAEGLYALMLYVEADQPAASALGGSGPAPDTVRRTATYDERIAEAKRLKWISNSWNEPGAEAMQRGVLARALAVICKVEGGVMMRLLGPNERYATRELAYLGVLSPGSEQQTMTGSEFISILSKAQDYQLLEEMRLEQEQKKREAKGAARAEATSEAN